MSVPGGGGAASGLPSKLGFPGAVFGGTIGVDAISFLPSGIFVGKRVSDGFKYVCLFFIFYFVFF